MQLCIEFGVDDLYTLLFLLLECYRLHSQNRP
jgi:hypothetical protein